MSRVKEVLNNIWKAISRVVVTNAIRLYSKIVYRYKVYGKENIPKEGALLFCGNHTTYFDGPLIIISSPRLMRFMAKQELKGNLLFRYLCYAYDAIYVKRDSKDVGPLKEALKTLKADGCIGLFPEGTRNGMEKNDGALKGGAAYLALKTGAKLVPIGVVGKAKPFSKNTFYYGEPIDISAYQTKEKDKEKENIEKVTEIIKEEILKLTTEKN